MRALMLGSAPGGGKWGTRSLMDLEIPGSRLPGGNVNGVGVAGGGGFPAFLPKEVHEIKDPFARSLARRIQRLPVQVGTSESCIMSSCIKPVIQGDKEPVVLLHCFDSSCLEWRRTYPLLEDTGVEAWAIDILGWGFSDLGFVFLPYFCFQLKYSAYFCVHVFLLFVFLLYVILLSPLQKDVQPVMLHRKDTIFTRFCSI
nr:2-hydroxy-6-oxononadienedioate/2-hydroxy-6-oxononatrienedioate hydrolase [Ipomoea batatas]GMC62208.1 2-hydroxy-6-oxononadienedioate/2-hydroxy-6-oxononatrienedioate hydrolase [Ipomoea batatas]